ncbi:Caffeic acid O-methyltransferase [Quillaja saponaria]|uniref:Caffeic acid O-methyltransferase n=1 Tax=Quillaja saponaria TaxID=32244 RepID=A0AAD7PDG6_QUISA|nr:Caffeic acid O-methyltransferase [Quillaja saponaria]
MPEKSSMAEIESPEQGKFSTEEECCHAMQVSNSIVFPMVMNAAVELGLLDIISKAGQGACLSPMEIASKLNTNNEEAPGMVDRILRLLASYSLVNCSPNPESNNANHSQRLYGLTSVGKYFLHDQEMSFAPALPLFHGKVFIDSWYGLRDAVLDGGIPFNKIHGLSAFEYFGKDPTFNEVFNKAMVCHTRVLMEAILEKYKGFENIKKLVDVGGGLGFALSMITSKYPSIEAINFDLPHVIKHAPQYPGIKLVAGDMLESVPQGEAIFLKGVLHDWNDELCVKILKNCNAALPNGGKIIIVDLLVPEGAATSAAAKHIFQVDLLMMTQHIGGKERTKKEFESIALTAGFKGVRFESGACGYGVIEFYK